MEITRRTTLKAGAGALTAAIPGGYLSVASAESDDEDESAETTLELLAEESVGHAHACSHAKFDERTPLSATENEADAPTVNETHVIWSVTYEGEQGYVTFDAEDHWHDGPFVFYLADGTADVVEGSKVEREEVDDEDCELLDEYLKAAQKDGRITLELVAHPTLEDYANESGIVETHRFRDAIDDWRSDDIERDLLRDVITAWQSNEPDA